MTKNNVGFLFETGEMDLFSEAPKIIHNMQKLATNGDISYAITLGEKLISLIDRKYIDNSASLHRRVSDEQDPDKDINTIKNNVQLLVDKLKEREGRESKEMDELKRRAGIL